MTVDEVVKKLRDGLDRIARERGITVVTMRASESRITLGVNSTTMVRALRKAGFWGQDGIWFAVAGADHVRLDLGGKD